MRNVSGVSEMPLPSPDFKVRSATFSRIEVRDSNLRSELDDLFKDGNSSGTPTSGKLKHAMAEAGSNDRHLMLISCLLNTTVPHVPADTPIKFAVSSSCFIFNAHLLARAPLLDTSDVYALRQSACSIEFGESSVRIVNLT